MHSCCVLRGSALVKTAAWLPFVSEEAWTTDLFALAYPFPERSQDCHCEKNRHDITPGDFIFVTSNRFSPRFCDATIELCMSMSCYFM